MDFFEAQDRARKRTAWLIALFVLAVIGTIVAGYFAAVFILHHVGARSAADGYQSYGYTAPELWQPHVLAWVALGTLVLVTASSLGKWLSLRGGGASVAKMLGGRRVDSATTDLKERQLLNVVEEMAIASGLALPAVFILDREKAINAFAAGLTTSDAVVAVTRGTLDRLSRDELQGVIGHEFSHILNGDMRLNLRLTSVLFGILVIALIGQGMLRSLRFAAIGHRRSRQRKGGGLAVLLAVGLALMLIGFIGYFFGRLIQAAVSRQREYLADAAAVQFTRHPGGIAGALRKIGGLALGSRLANPRAAQFNHAFFGQNFRAGFTGLFATHPPLLERIRAIDPQFDGKYIEPPQQVDVTRESFRTAGFGPAQAAALRESPPADRRISVQPDTLARSVGLPTPAHLDHARELLAGLPVLLHEAAHRPDQAVALLYALLLDNEPSIREQQLKLVEQQDQPARGELAALEGPARGLPAASRLPLLQLCLPVLNDLDRAGLERLLGTLDELVHADARVTIFEYALQKVIAHHLELSRRPSVAGRQIQSFAAVREDLEQVLSVFAHAAADDEAGAVRAFAAGSSQLRMLEPAPALLGRDSCTLERLDAALDHLERTSLPIKKRLIAAACHVIGADGTVRETEAELLRAVCAALDCPMPPMI